MSNDQLAVSAKKGLVWAARWFQLVLVALGAVLGSLTYWMLLNVFVQLPAPWDLLVPLTIVAAISVGIASVKRYRRYSIPFVVGIVAGAIMTTAFFGYLFRALAEGFGARF